MLARIGDEAAATLKVQAADSLLKLVSELKQTAIFSGFASLNDHVDQKTAEFNRQADNIDRGREVIYDPAKKKYCMTVRGSEDEKSFTITKENEDENVGGSQEIISGSLWPLPLDDDEVTKAAEFAVEKHNKTTGANIILKKIAKAFRAKTGVEMVLGGSMLFMALETLDGDGDQTQPDVHLYDVEVSQDMDGAYVLDLFSFYKAKAKTKGALELNPGGYAVSSSPKRNAQRYQESGSENVSPQKRAFFDAHKDEEWLKNKYHPTNLLGVIERRNERAQKIAKDFLLRLIGGILDLSPCVTAFSPSKSGQTSEPNCDDEAAYAGRKRRKHDKSQDEEGVFSAALNAHPVSPMRRQLESDTIQAHALIQKLDIEKGIEDNVLCDVHFLRSKFGIPSVIPVVVISDFPAERVLCGNRVLGTLLAYLWCIHGVNYYGMIENDEPKGFRHVRADAKNHGETSESGVEWEKKLDSFWQKRLSRQGPLEAMAGKEKIDAADIEALDQYVRKIDDENNGWKYGCEAKGCSQLFHCAECVHEHLKLKHPELVMELTSKVREDLYFHNYMNDPDACGGTPDMKQP